MSIVSAAFSPEDEFSHEASDDEGYSESVYFNFVADGGQLAGFMRIGNRVNAGHAEVTVLFYLPDGGAAFRYSRPAIDGPSFDLEGLTVEVLDPLERLRLTYAGEAHVMADGRAMSDPRSAFASSPVQPLSFVLDFEDLMPVIGWKFGDSGTTIDPGGAYAPNHYEAECRVTGTMTLDGQELAIRGRGLRDHSWGTRDWVAPDFYRWISCFTPSGDGWVVWFVKIAGEGRAWGFLRADGETHPIEDVAVESEYDGAEHYPSVTTVSFTADGERYENRGERVNIVPLRHRRGDSIARLAEVVFRYESFRGETGHGIAEFHDRMVDGVPSGMGHA